MTSKEHRKHSFITKPAFGNYSRNEWAILGTTCSKIQELAHRLVKGLHPIYTCAYLDAEHAQSVENKNQEISAQPLVTYVSHDARHSFDFNTGMNFFHLRHQFAQADLALVNGNHHQAKAQVLVIDEVKRFSLQKKLDQLTAVELILLAEGETEVFDFLRDVIPDLNDLPVFALHETDKIIRFFTNKMAAAKPLVNGLVLAGGQSTRMGHDKTAIGWHGKEQRYYMADLMRDFSEQVFISCRKDQAAEIDPSYNILTDSFEGLGPYGAILSAFRENPDRAWFVIASDLPLLGNESLAHLLAARDTAGIATTFESSWDGLPEPLVTIWEPKSYPLLLSFLSQGYSCPRKVLMNNRVKIIKAPVADALLNVNTPEEAEKVKHILEQKIVQH